jgi:type 1 glutamine amidotransferase
LRLPLLPLWLTLGLLAVLPGAAPATARRPVLHAQEVQQAQDAVPARPAHVLMVTATAGFHHDSIATAQAVMRRLAGETGRFQITLLPDVPDLERFTAATLAEQDVVFFANTSGELPLDGAQQQALLDFVAAGGGFVATHSATDTFYEWPDYERLVGAWFKEHPWTQTASVVVEDQAHPTTVGLGDSFALLDEFYVFRTSPREGAHVLLRLDAATAGAVDAPLAWCGAYGAGRTYYNALGHFDSTWLDERFQRQIVSALLWASHKAPAGATGADGGDAAETVDTATDGDQSSCSSSSGTDRAARSRP